MFATRMLVLLLALALTSIARASAASLDVEKDVADKVSQCEQGAGVPGSIAEDQDGQPTWVPAWPPERTLELANSGDVEAMLAIADCLWEGRFGSAAKKNVISFDDIDAMVKSQVLLEAEATVWYQKAVDRNSKVAMVSLAKKLMADERDKNSKLSGIRLYAKAAAAGDISAIRVLWDAYLQGDVVLQDYAKAHSYLEMGAEAGDALSQYELGRFLSDKTHFPEDLVAAYKWFLIANFSGYRNQDKDLIQRRLSPEQMMDAQAAAKQWLAAKGIQMP